MLVPVKAISLLKRIGKAPDVFPRLMSMCYTYTFQVLSLNCAMIAWSVESTRWSTLIAKDFATDSPVVDPNCVKCDWVTSSWLLCSATCSFGWTDLPESWGTYAHWIGHIEIGYSHPSSAIKMALHAAVNSACWLRASIKYPIVPRLTSSLCWYLLAGFSWIFTAAKFLDGCFTVLLVCLLVKTYKYQYCNMSKGALLSQRP